MIRSAWLLAALVILCALVSSSSWGETKMPEIRGIWVARWDIASPQACSDLVRLAKEHDFNTLVVQVRGRGDALYNSSYEPRSELLVGQSEDFDPLAQIVKEGHAAGLQVHAWINANYTWASATPPVSPEHIVNKHPDWLMRTADNEVNMTGGDDVEGAYTCPSNELFREFLKNIYLDVVTKYPVDGVHFDFIRYPSTRFCYCDRCLSKFEAAINAKLSPEQRFTISNLPGRTVYTREFPQAWDDFRRAQITKIVYMVSDAVKKAKPGVEVSAAVFSNSHDAYHHRFQDWKRWLKDGKIDVLYPMAYATDTKTFAEHIADAVSSCNGVPICAGIGSWQITAESTVEKIVKARELGAAGFCLFSWAVTKSGTDASYMKFIQDKALRGPGEHKQ